MPEKSSAIEIKAGQGFSYVLPSKIYEGSGQVEIKFRLKEKVVRKTLVAKCGANILGKRFVLAGVPGEMMSLCFDKSGAIGEISLEIE